MTSQGQDNWCVTQLFLGRCNTHVYSTQTRTRQNQRWVGEEFAHSPGYRNKEHNWDWGAWVGVIQPGNSRFVFFCCVRMPLWCDSSCMDLAMGILKYPIRVSHQDWEWLWEQCQDGIRHHLCGVGWYACLMSGVHHVNTEIPRKQLKVIRNCAVFKIST